MKLIRKTKIQDNLKYYDLSIPVTHNYVLANGLVAHNTGVGYSVQKHHVERLLMLRGPIRIEDRRKRPRRFLISDSIEGWADSIKALLNTYFKGEKEIEFDYRDIRPKGARLVTSGGKAPGPQPLKDCIHNIKKVLNTALEERGTNTKLKPIEAHDIMCFIADAVLAGGIRRAAMISLFSFDDEEMLASKYGNWWELNPQRGRANNSVVALRHRLTKEDFYELWEKIKASGTGEPGLYFTNDKEWGTNPCCEIGLRPNQFCNLTTINASDVENQEELEARAKAAAFISTLQASYTDFHYLREIWRETTEKEALIGVSMTGIASGNVLKLDMREASHVVKEENKRIAKLIGINKAARTTCTKPEGCLTKDTIVSTKNGILSLEEIGDVDGNQWQDHDISVYTDSEIRKSNKFYVNGFTKTKKIILGSGIELESTCEHKFRVFTEDGKYIWKKSNDLEIGDRLPYSVGEYDGGSYQTLNKIEFNNSQHATRTKVTKQPDVLDEDIAWLLGLYFGDGTNKDRSIRIYGNIDEQKGFEKAKRILKEKFGLDTVLKKRVSDNPNEKRCHLQINSKELLNFLSANNIKKQYSYEIEIPIEIRMSPKSVIQAFIDGYQVADGSDKGSCISFSTVSEKFAKQLVITLRAIGHDSKIRIIKRKELNENTKHKGNRDSYWISIRKGRKGDQSKIRKSTKESWKKLDDLGYDNFSLDTVIDIYDSENYTYDISVDHEDHTYIASSYITHNTSSLVLGTSPGIHAWHNDYYLRRIRVGKNESIYTYLSIRHPELLEDEYFKPDQQAVITVPQKAPEGAITRHETAIDLLERMKLVTLEWVHNGHRSGSNKHNVSITVSVKDDEWDKVADWMWENRKVYNGITVLPHNGGEYKQAPFEDCTKDEYERRLQSLKRIDLTQVIEQDDSTNLTGELACSSGACTIT